MAHVEKFNPLKGSALSRKRDAQKEGKWGKKVCINEINLEDVRNDAVSFGIATDVIFQMKAGKEASIYLAEWKGHPIVLKAYRFWQTAQASKKKGVNAPEMMDALAAKEFFILSRCFEEGVDVPTPIGRVGNYLTMRLIGDGIEAAPQLRDVRLENPDDALDMILDQYLIMYSKANYVHGDLSGYNVLWWNQRPWIIDVPQAVRIGAWTDMNNAKALLRRDIVNLLSYFKRYYKIRRNVDQILETFLSEYVPDNLRNFEEDVGVWIR